MPGYVNGIPHATSSDRIDLWPTTSRNLAQWVDDNVPRNDDPRLTNARPPTTHTHPISGVTGLQAALNGKTDTTDPRLSDARPPTAHQHALADVAGLAARLAALEQDTGWRDVSAWMPDGTVEGKVFIRRIGAVVYWQFRLSKIIGTGQNPTVVTPGFRPGLGIYDGFVMRLERYGNTDVHGQISLNGSGTLSLYGAVPVTGTFLLTGSHLSYNPFPSTLPGIPA